jgi:hypothetical protein
MTASVIDAYTLLTSLKATGKDANYTAEELVNAFGVAQVAVDLLTVPVFESRMSVVDAKFDAFDASWMRSAPISRPKSSRARCRTCRGCPASC